MTNTKTAQVSPSEDPRKVALLRLGIIQDPPPLYLCAHDGCVNTLLVDGQFCDFHGEW